MAMRACRLCLCVLAAALAACGDRSALERRATAPPARRLAGTWDVRFDLERPPVLTERTTAVAQVVRGRIALLANRWLTASYPRLGTPTDYGTYDIDFTPFGFEPRTPGQTPTAVAGWLATDSDSVEIILAPDQDRAVIAMRGKFANDSIAGAWDVSIARATGGGGRFLMSRVGGR